MNPGRPKTRTASFEPVGRDPLADLRPVQENARKFCARRILGLPAEAANAGRSNGAGGAEATAEANRSWSVARQLERLGRARDVTGNSAARAALQRDLRAWRWRELPGDALNRP